MKRFEAIALAIMFGLFVALLSCNDPLQIGTELIVDGDDINLLKTDTVTVDAVTVQLDSLIAFRSPNIAFFNHRLGWLSDPIFGDHRSNIVAQLFPGNFTRPTWTSVDSVVLSVEYDSSGLYGIDNPFFDISVNEITSSFSVDQTLYTDTDLNEGSLLGSVSGLMPISLTDSISITEINSLGVKDTLRAPAQMRFNLNNSFGEMLLNIDSINYTNIDSFTNVFPGIILKSTSISNAMLPLKPSSLAGATFSKVSVFYRNGVAEIGQFDFVLGGALFSKHEHDYSTGTIDGSIDNAVASKDLLYIQGGGGPSISIKLPYLASLSSVIINEATLQVTRELLPQDDENRYPLPDQLILVYQSDSTLVNTADLGLATLGFGDVTLFGGQPTEITSGGITRIQYTFNISDHIQGMISGELSNEFFITLESNSVNVERAVFKGIDSSTDPIKVNITYTEL